MGRDVAYDLASHKKAEEAALLATRADASKRKKKPSKTSKVGTLPKLGKSNDRTKNHETIEQGQSSYKSKITYIVRNPAGLFRRRFNSCIVRDRVRLTTVISQGLPPTSTIRRVDPPVFDVAPPRRE